MPYTDPIPDNIITQFIAYEEGKLNDDETIDFFQALVDTGLAKKFGGEYATTATLLLKAGIVKEERLAA